MTACPVSPWPRPQAGPVPRPQAGPVPATPPQQEGQSRTESGGAEASLQSQRHSSPV